MSKTVIEFLAEDDTAEYEDLLQRLRTSVMANGATVSEDSLLRFAEFVCDRVYHFDAAGADGEPQVGSPPPPPPPPPPHAPPPDQRPTRRTRSHYAVAASRHRWR